MLSRLWRPVALVLLLIGPLLAIGTYKIGRAYEDERIRSAFEDIVAERAQRLEQQVLAYTETLHACRGLFDASEQVTPEEFDVFTRGARSRHPDILALAWVPQEAATAAPAAVADESSSAAPAPDAEPGAEPASAYVVRYVQPLAAASVWLGESLGTVPQRAHAIDAALSTRKAVLSAPHVLPGSIGTAGMVLLLAVGPGAEGRAAEAGRASGLVLLAFGVRDVLNLIELQELGGRSPAASLSLTDLSTDTHVLGQIEPTASAVESGIRASQPLSLARRPWRLDGVPTARFLSENRRMGEWLLALGVFVLWECFAGFLLAMGHSVRAHALARHARMVSRVLDSLTDGIVVADAQGRVRLANPAARRLLTAPGGKPSESGRWALGGCLLLADGRTPLAGDQQPLRRALRGETVAEQESMVRCVEDSNPSWLLLSAAPVLDEKGNQDGGMLVLRDVSERRRLRQREVEMDLAAQVQQRLYPTEALQQDCLEIAGVVMPADETCGDYFDYFVLGDGSVCIAVGDVSGHGFGPALVMAETRAYLRSLAGPEHDPGKILTRINDLLVQDLGGELFVTLLLVCVDPRTGAVRYASAGQTPGFVLAEDGETRAILPASGPPLGLFEDREYESRNGPVLQARDLFVFMTDGASECPSQTGELLEEEGVLAVARAHVREQPKQLLERLSQAILNHQGPGAPRDDVTFLVGRFHHTGPAQVQRSRRRTSTHANSSAGA